MAGVIEGELRGEGLRFGIVASRFNDFITSRLLEGALDAFRSHGVREEDLTVVRVPGAFEIPVVARRLAGSGRFHAILCLGAVIRGETPHFEYLCAETSRGIGSVALETGLPVLFGVLTTDTVGQAEARAGGKSNKGWEAALAALEMANVMAKLSDVQSPRSNPSGTSDFGFRTS